MVVVSIVAMTTLIVLGSSVGSDDDNARVRPKKLWQDLTIWTTTRQVAAVVCRPELLLSFSWPPPASVVNTHGMTSL